MCRFLFGLTLLLGLSIDARAQQTIVAASRSIDWTKAGVTGGIPPRTIICTTFNPGATAGEMNSAIASCPSGQVVKLNAGTYNLSTGIVAAKNNVTLRGSGPDSTFLVFTGNAGCGGKFAPICVIGPYAQDSPYNLASWTAGYSQGSTSITIGSISGLGIKPVAGTALVLDQLSDLTDTGDTFVCVTQNTCAQGGGHTNSDYVQQQLVTVTSISSGACPCTVGISPGIYMPNWRSGQSPRVWWTGNQTSNTLPVTGVGIEDMSVNSSSSNSQFGISFFWATNSWIKNVRSIRQWPEPVGHYSNKHVLIFLSTHITIRDSYFFGRIGDDDYGVDTFWCSNNLIENNIFQHIPLPMQNEKGVGNVWAYNYSINNLWGPGAGAWAQGSSAYHGPGSSYELWEGNDGHGLELENYFGEVHFITAFRNRWTGWDAPQDAQTVPVFIYSLSRYSNIIGNVLGTVGYHNTYKMVAGDTITSNCPQTIFVIGLGGNCNNGGSAPYPPNDTLTVNSLMRWGNYDTVTGSNRFLASEVPTGLSRFPNPLPPNQTLPASFYLSARPGWWGSMPWPAIGPDVVGGDIPNVAGRAYRIPARKCFETVMGGTFRDTTARPFNPAICYPNSPSPPTPSNFQVIKSAALLLPFVIAPLYSRRSRAVRRSGHEGFV